MMLHNLEDASTRKRPVVLLLAETGFIIRNLLLGTFAKDVAKACDLVVAVQNPEDELLGRIIKAIPHARLIPFPAESYELDPSTLKRFWLWDNWIYGIRSATHSSASLKLQTRLFEQLNKRKRFMRLIPFYLGKILAFCGLQSFIEDFYLKKVTQRPVSKIWTSLLKSIEPDLVFSTMLSHSNRFRCSTDLPVVVAAHKAGIPVCTLIQSWDNLSSKISVLPKWVDRYYTWSATMTNELLHFNPRIHGSRVRIVGSPQFDYHLDQSLQLSREVYLKKLGLDQHRKYVVIGTGTAQWMPDEMQKTVQLANTIRTSFEQLQVVIRLHPKDEGSRWKPYENDLMSSIIIQRTSPEVHMDQGGFLPPEDFFSDQINVILHSDMVINSSSSISIDAAIFDKPVICIAYDIQEDRLFPEGRARLYTQSEHFGKLVSTGGITVVNSEVECLNAVRSYLENPGLHLEERKKIVEMVCDKLNQRAGTRLANEIIAFLDGKAQ